MKGFQLKAIAEIIFLLVFLANHSQYASSLFSSPGEVFPANAEIEVGDSLNITCQLNKSVLQGKSSKDLLFVDADTQVPVAGKDVAIVNDTAIVYMLRNATEQQTKLMCKCGDDALMVAKLYVGYKPLPVQNFSCRSFDFEYMLCNFTEPPNALLTIYNLSYYIDSPDYKYYPKCNHEEKPFIVCNTTLRKYNPYHYTLAATNELGNYTENFTINYLNIMEPGKPGENIRIVDKTTNSLEVAWKMPKYDKYRPKGLKWEILLQPQHFEVQNLSEILSPKRFGGEWHLDLKNLSFAWYPYELHLRVGVNVPNSPWSQKFIYNFRTGACKPYRSPKVLPGSFYIDSTETKVKIYWEQLKDFELNGDNLTYLISEVIKDGQKR